MRRGTRALVAVLCSGLMLAGGCAKKELLKPEEAAPIAAPQPAPAVPAPTTTAPPVKEEPVAAQPVADIPVKAEAPSQQPLAAEEAGVMLERVFFDFDSFVLSQTARDILYRNAEVLLKKQASLKVMLEGHCDERGSDEYNLALGEKRAKAARDYLTTLGVQPERLSIISYGKEKPLDPGHGEDAWAKNRRVEFVVAR